MRVLIALGGNALLERGQPPDAALQLANLRRAAASVAEIARRHEVIVTHGNGPQVGLLALQSAALERVPPYPLDVLGAQTEGMIGYWIELELRNQLAGREVATLLTQTEVAAGDPAFAAPAKLIGPLYGEAEAREQAAARGWRIAPDGAGFRRVVPSPEPLRILELQAIERLVESGILVVCAGGGGVPVVAEGEGFRGVEAVIDKDLVASLLALLLRCDALLMLTDVEAVYRDWPARSDPFARVEPAALRARSFDPGSMGPKVEAACRFAERAGAMAGIGALARAGEILEGKAGTRVYPPGRA